MSVVGFSGSRSLSSGFSRLVSRVVRGVVASGRGVAVGCARGADSLVREACLSAAVFRVSGPRFPGALVARSVRLVRFVAGSGSGCQLVGFVSVPCPVGLVPSRFSSRCFAGFGSGTWASLALAAGLGVPVVVFLCGCGPEVLPAWPGGRWVRAGSGPLVGGFVFYMLTKGV
jgi:hypothetical protein